MHELTQEQIKHLFGSGLVKSVQSTSPVKFHRGSLTTTYAEIDAPADFIVTFKTGAVVQFGGVESWSITIERLQTLEE